MLDPAYNIGVRIAGGTQGNLAIKAVQDIPQVETEALLGQPFLVSGLFCGDGGGSRI